MIKNTATAIIIIAPPPPAAAAIIIIIEEEPEEPVVHVRVRNVSCVVLFYLNLDLVTAGERRDRRDETKNSLEEAARPTTSIDFGVKPCSAKTRSGS